MYWNVEERQSEKMRSDERTIVLKVKDGLSAKDVLGKTDPRLFNGENALTAVKDINGLWYMKYKVGAVPAPLKQKFTKFNDLVQQAAQYFRTRNIEILEVRD